jgi:hypothetical protein
MPINAYVLAADPTWIEASILSYYDLVGKIVVSYDALSRGWTGAPINVRHCLSRLAAIDRDNKLVMSPGYYSREEHTPIENDTHQRQCALDEAGIGADWVLQLDTDEVLPRQGPLIQMLAEAERRDIGAVEWPMRVLFRKLGSGRFLEVCAKSGADRFEYPGPVAIRPGSRLVNARRTTSAFLRPVVRGDVSSLQVCRPLETGERRTTCESADAILHNSWARDAVSIRQKIRSWSHNDGWRTYLFYLAKWKPAPLLWRFMRDLHPFARDLWPALKLCPSIDLVPAKWL